MVKKEKLLGNVGQHERITDVEKLKKLKHMNLPIYITVLHQIQACEDVSFLTSRYFQAISNVYFHPYFPTFHPCPKARHTDCSFSNRIPKTSYYAGHPDQTRKSPIRVHRYGRVRSSRRDMGSGEYAGLS